MSRIERAAYVTTWGLLVLAAVLAVATAGGVAYLVAVEVYRG